MPIETISPEQYAIERAICDKANAYVERVCAAPARNYLTAEEAKDPDYAACNNDMRGRVEQFEILRDLPETIVAYMTLEREESQRTNIEACKRWTVSTWSGHKLGFANETSRWKTPNSFMSSHMSQFMATIGGRTYTGRCGGSGMAITLKETAASKRKRGV